jgi:LuxR family maltose regulon positive regulatory protein
MTQIPSVAIPALQRLAAAELFVEQSTVKTHLVHLYRKLGVHSRTQAVARARALGLLD